MRSMHISDSFTDRLRLSGSVKALRRGLKESMDWIFGDGATVGLPENFGQQQHAWDHHVVHVTSDQV